ncbi:hypothetical protein GSH19_06685 [Lactobacillus sp. S2-2]|nr:hypothetical protein [Lactobacillus sp. S2-2]
MIIKLNQNKNGFSILESLIVLIIFCFFSGLFFIGLNLLRMNQKYDYFWNNFHSVWQYEIMISKKHKCETNVYFFTDEKIIFKNFYNKKMHTKTIKLSSDLVPTKYDTVRISENGFVSPKTIMWSSKNKKKNIRQTFQLGWGVYKIYE